MSEHSGHGGNQSDQNKAEAQAIKETATAAVLATCLGKTYGKVIGSLGFKAYVDEILSAAGAPKDPIEQMMVQQLLLAHHRIGDLHAQAACAASPEVAALYNAAAVRLMGEFRKTGLALREYRTPAVSKNVTLVKQQNVAAGNQQIAYVDGEKPAEKSSSRSELVSNEPKALTNENPITLHTEPAESRGRKAEPVEAEKAEPLGTTTPTRSRSQERAVEAIDRAENGGG